MGGNSAEACNPRPTLPIFLHLMLIFGLIVVLSSLLCVLKQGFAFLLELNLFSSVSCFVRKCCETAKIGCTQHQFSFIIIIVIILMLPPLSSSLLSSSPTPTKLTILSTSLENHALHRMFVSDLLLIFEFFCR